MSLMNVLEQKIDRSKLKPYVYIRKKKLFVPLLVENRKKWIKECLKRNKEREMKCVLRCPWTLVLDYRLSLLLHLIDIINYRKKRESYTISCRFSTRNSFFYCSFVLIEICTLFSYAKEL